VKANYADYRDLQLADPDGLRKWREDAEHQEQEFARECREREQERQRAAEATEAREAASVRAQFEARLVAVEQANRELYADLAGIARATREAIESLADERVDLSREQRDEIHELKIEVAKLGSTLAELREQQAKGTFRFAREREDEVTELPNPLPPRPAIN
jgi:hypothetical protein